MPLSPRTCFPFSDEAKTLGPLFWQETDLTDRLRKREFRGEKRQLFWLRVLGPRHNWRKGCEPWDGPLMAACSISTRT